MQTSLAVIESVVVKLAGAIPDVGSRICNDPLDPTTAIRGVDNTRFGIKAAKSAPPATYRGTKRQIISRGLMRNDILLKFLLESVVGRACYEYHKRVPYYQVDQGQH